MSRRWLVALALVAGCGSAGGGAPGVDAAGDHASPNDIAGDVAPEARPDAGDARPDRGVEAGPAGDARDAGDAADVRVDGLPSDMFVQSFCPATIPNVSPTSGPVTGVLTGTSNNPAVSCGNGVITAGPDATFTLTIAEPTTVDIVVSSPVDTLIALRPGLCSDSITELTCGRDPPKVDPSGDGGAPTDAGATASSLRRTGLRTPLAAGTYTLVVDTLSLAPLTRADFTMTISRIQPRPNAVCSAPTVLQAPSTTTDESLDLAGAPSKVCGGGSQLALYYAVGVPSGQRLTARATPRLGDHTWMPRLEAFNSCAAATCLAQGRSAAGTTQQLDWTNNGANWQLVYLAVGSDSPVSGATFDLTVNVLDLFATCSRPTPVQDGTVLVGQDLTVAPTPTTTTCTGSNNRAFYYTTTLLPQQKITATATPSATGGAGGIGGFPPGFGMAFIVSVRSSCDAASCNSGGQQLDFTNQTTSDQQILLEVTSLQSNGASLFDLHIMIPLPPPAVAVTPTSGLVTTEAGAAATFTVVLRSPPTSDVAIGLTSDTPSEGTVSPATLHFDASNWRTPQTATVTGVDDQLSDGARDYTILTTVTTADASYSGLDAPDVAVTNLDDDPGVTFAGASDVATSESGGKGTFTVRLNAAPTATVTIPLSSSDIGEGTVSPAALVFSTTNWNMPQTVTVTGVDDAMVDGTQSYTIVTGPLTSTDTRYGGQDPADVVAHNLDDDQVAVAVKIISGDHSCSLPGSSPIAVDLSGNIFITLLCETGISFVTSTDGGVTFSDPKVIAGTESTANGFALMAGGDTGFAYLAFMSNADNSILFARTTDGGATWSTPAPLSTPSGNVRLTAAGRTVLALTDGTDGSGNTMTLSRSVDGGHTFLPRTTVAGGNLDIALEPGGVTAWMVDINSPNALLKSTDGGASFTHVIDLNLSVDSHYFGRTRLFSGSNSPLAIINLASPTMVTQSIGFINGQPFAYAGDDLDTVTMLDLDPDTGHLRGIRVTPGAPLPTGGRVVSPAPSSAGIVALSRKATGIVLQSGNIVLYTTAIWP
jgi:hypothetical protein